MAAWAQYQVNNQLYGNPGPSIKYGWGPGYATPSTVQIMPSEWKNAAFLSGALPSDIRMNYASIGPNAPLQAYIPAPGPRYEVGRPGPVGNYIPSAQMSQQAVTVGRLQPLPPSAALPAIPGSGSVRYSSPMSASAGIAPRSYSAGPIGAAMPIGAAAPAGYRISGSVRYGG